MLENESLLAAEYWRDLHLKVFGWGVAASLIVMGWAMSSGDLFCFEVSGEYQVRAIGFTTLVILVGITWFVCINYLHNRATKTEYSSGLQIVSKSYINIIAIAWLSLAIAVAAMSGINCADDIEDRLACNKASQVGR